MRWMSEIAGCIAVPGAFHGQFTLREPARSGNLRAHMSNRAIWNVRRRHEWLTTPLKGKRFKLRQRKRVGAEEARARTAAAAGTDSAQS
jgi:hypothetical protein